MCPWVLGGRRGSIAACRFDSDVVPRNSVRAVPAPVALALLAAFATCPVRIRRGCFHYLERHNLRAVVAGGLESSLSMQAPRASE